LWIRAVVDFMVGRWPLLVRAHGERARYGRLTLSKAAGGQNNKIAFMDIKSAGPGAVESQSPQTCP
jgi:hypothetical protein